MRLDLNADERHRRPGKAGIQCVWSLLVSNSVSSIGDYRYRVRLRAAVRVEPYVLSKRALCSSQRRPKMVVCRVIFAMYNYLRSLYWFELTE